MTLEETVEYISNILKKHFEDNPQDNVTQLAKRIGISRSTVAKLKDNIQSKSNRDTIVRLTKFFPSMKKILETPVYLNPKYKDIQIKIDEYIFINDMNIHKFSQANGIPYKELMKLQTPGEEVSERILKRIELALQNEIVESKPIKKDNYSLEMFSTNNIQTYDLKLDKNKFYVLLELPAKGTESKEISYNLKYVKSFPYFITFQAYPSKYTCTVSKINLLLGVSQLKEQKSFFECKSYDIDMKWTKLLDKPSLKIG